MNRCKAAAPRPTTRGSRRKPLASYRTLVNYKTAKFQPYYLQGETQSDISWVNLSYDEKTGDGFFLVKFRPGGCSIPHEHLKWEEFVVLEGSIEDCDGTVYKAGDCVSLKAGSRHVSSSKSGATTAVFIRGGFRNLTAREKVDS
ncbi:MAG: cupin [Alphaproteobacteria bacterium]|nr:cupin [Alphaproteobacteria bacterium]